MVGRVYKCQFEKVSIAAVQDLFQVKGAAGKMLLIKEVSISSVDVTLPIAQMMALRCRFLPATVSDGTGGSSVTPSAIPGDAAASFTCLINNTSKATTSGTAVIHLEDGAHLYAGYKYQFPDAIPVGPSESFVFELITAPGATWVCSGFVRVIEIGG